MAYNAISGTLVAAQDYIPGNLIVANVVSGTLKGDGSNIEYVPRVSNATNNAIITNVGGDANTLTCESNLTFDGSVLSVTGELTASVGVSASFFEGDGSRLEGVASSTLVATAIVHGSSLVAGFNFFTGALGSAAAATVSLPETPSPVTGQVFHVKAPSNCNSIRRITVATSGTHTIDELDSVILESPYGAVSFIYAVSGSWLLY